MNYMQKKIQSFENKNKFYFSKLVRKWYFLQESVLRYSKLIIVIWRMEVDSEESEESDYFECEAAITGSLSLNLESDSEKIKTIQISEMGRESKSECMERNISCFGLFSEDLTGLAER